MPDAIGYFFQGIGRFMLILLRFFQEFAIAGLIAVSPLLIGFLFFSYTQSLGVQFGVTSLTVLLWHVAICLVDIVIQAISDTLFMPITANNLVQVGTNLIVVNNWLMFPFIMAFASFLTVFFYLSVPFVASAVMKGLSGTTATLQAGVQGAMQTAGLIAGAGLTAAGAAATFGGSAAVQTALEETRAAAEGATAAGRIANDFAGAGGFAPGAPALGGGGSDLPNRRGLPATVGEGGGGGGDASRTGPIPAQVASRRRARMRASVRSTVRTPARNPVGPDLPIFEPALSRTGEEEGGDDVSGAQPGVQGTADSPEGRSHED